MNKRSLFSLPRLTLLVVALGIAFVLMTFVVVSPTHASSVQSAAKTTTLHFRFKAAAKNNGSFKVDAPLTIKVASNGTFTGTVDAGFGPAPVTGKLTNGGKNISVEITFSGFGTYTIDGKGTLQKKGVYSGTFVGSDGEKGDWTATPTK